MSFNRTPAVDSQSTLQSHEIPVSQQNGNNQEAMDLNPASPSDPEKENHQEKPDEEEWKFSTRVLLIFVTLSTLTLMAALDGTSISVALPVRFPFPCRSLLLP
jgi:hypothetical protein